jgi:hypothetical protein
MDTEDSFPEVKRPGCKADHPTPSSAEVKKARSTWAGFLQRPKGGGGETQDLIGYHVYLCLNLENKFRNMSTPVELKRLINKLKIIKKNVMKSR